MLRMVHASAHLAGKYPNADLTNHMQQTSASTSEGKKLIRGAQCARDEYKAHEGGNL